MEELNEPITKSKKKPMKIQEENHLAKEGEPSENVEDTTVSVESKKPKRKYTMTEKKQQQLVLLQEGKNRADAERKRMKELEAYKAIVENKLMEDVILKTKEKLATPKKKPKKIIVVEESESESEQEFDDNEEEEEEEDNEIDVVKKKFPLKKQEPKSFKSLKNKKSDKQATPVQKQPNKPPSARVHQQEHGNSHQPIDYSKYFV
jgi:hypothetical protein